MADINWDLLSLEDLQAYQDGNYDAMSEDSLRYLTGTPFDTSEVAKEVAGRTFSSTLRGALDLAGGSIGPLSLDKEKDQQQENRYRMMMETNPVAATVSAVVGGFADPFFLPASFLAPVKVGGAIATGAARGAVAGAATGALEPVYSDLGDSRLFNVGAGAALGAGFGAGAGWLQKLIDAKAAKVIEPPQPGEPLRIEWNGKQGQLNSKGDFVDADGVVIKTAAEAEAEALKEVGLPKGDFKWNPEAGRVETQTTVTPTVNFDLPRSLAGAKPRFNTEVVQFDHSLDKAFYVVGGKGKSNAHDLYMGWLKQVTGKTDAEVQALAKQARKEIVDNAKAKVLGNEAVTQPLTRTSQQLISALQMPKLKVEPYVPTKTVTKTSFNEEDVTALDKVGLSTFTTRDGRVQFRDKLNRNKIVSNAEMQKRLQGLGWDVQLPKKVKEQKAAAVEEQATREAQQELGIPTQPASIGAAGVKPATQYGPEFAKGVDQNAVEAFVKDPFQFPAVRVGMEEVSDDAAQAMIDRLHSIFYPSLAKGAKLSGSMRNIARRGVTKREKIKNEFGNLAEFALANPNRALTAEETAAVAPLVEMAKNERRVIIDKLADFQEQGLSFDTKEVADMAADLMYYEGINMWWKGTGTLASRALNARKLIYKNLKEGKKSTAIFPGVKC